jgi:hypothetical protein
MTVKLLAASVSHTELSFVFANLPANGKQAPVKMKSLKTTLDKEKIAY